MPWPINQLLSYRNKDVYAWVALDSIKSMFKTSLHGDESINLIYLMEHTKQHEMQTPRSHRIEEVHSLVLIFHLLIRQSIQSGMLGMLLGLVIVDFE